MGELILPGDDLWRLPTGAAPETQDPDYERGRGDAMRTLREANGRGLSAAQIDFTIDQGPDDEPVSRAYVLGCQSAIPHARVVWNDGERITVIDGAFEEKS